jgi:Glycosyl transferase family 90
MAASNSNDTRSVVFADPSGSGRFVTATVPVADMNNEFMNTTFTKAVGCGGFEGGCEGMQKHYRFSEHVPMGEHWRHKYLVDVDGMGYSARVMALLASDSAVLKATIYREFFTDWIQPWCVFHLYRPGVSGGMWLMCGILTWRQVALHPALTVLQGDLQYPCLLFRAVTLHAQLRQLLRPAELYVTRRAC